MSARAEKNWPWRSSNGSKKRVDSRLPVFFNWSRSGFRSHMSLFWHMYQLIIVINQVPRFLRCKYFIVFQWLSQARLLSQILINASMMVDNKFFFVCALLVSGNFHGKVAHMTCDLIASHPNPRDVTGLINLASSTHSIVIYSDVRRTIYQIVLFLPIHDAI